MIFRDDNNRYSRPAARPLACSFIAAFIAAAIFCFTAVTQAQAAPAAPTDFPLTQPDGSIFQARQWGDEWSHGYETVEGYSILNDPASGTWVYASVDTQGRLVAAPAVAPLQQGSSSRSPYLVVGKDSPADLEKHLRPLVSSQVKPRRSVQLPPVNEPQRSRLNNAAAATQHNLLVLLVQFDDRFGRYAPEDIQPRFFGETGSVKDYYRTASLGQLAMQPAAETYGVPGDGLVGWLSLPYNHPNDLYQSPRIVNDALVAADPFVNFASFDQDSNGTLSANELDLVVLVAGYEQSLSGASTSNPGIWAHSWSLDNGYMDFNPLLDGVQIGQSLHGGAYAVFGEVHARSGYPENLATIGVIVHELGHNLGWPDLYDDRYASAGVGAWSVMAFGGWNASPQTPYLLGSSPALPDAWSRWYQGWISPTQAHTGASFTLGAASSAADALLLGSNPNGVDWRFQQYPGTGEYWLVENRQRSGYDSGLPGCGLLIYHIDESVQDVYRPNSNREHPLVRLEEADGRKDLYYYFNEGDAGDPYPGLANRMVFPPAGDPGSMFYNPQQIGFGLTLVSAGCSSQMTVIARETPAAKQVFLPTAMRQMSFNLSSYSGVVTQNGTPVTGTAVYLALSKDSGGTWDGLYMRTTTGPEGRFEFNGLPRPSSQTRFYVYYPNEERDPSRLLYWACPTITSPAQIQSPTACNLNVANISLLAPLPGATVRLPYTFEWTGRSSSGETYVIEIYQGDEWHPYLGDIAQIDNQDRVIVNDLARFSTNTSYLWTVRVNTNQGYGMAWEWREIMFK